MDASFYKRDETVNIERALKIEGWMQPVELEWLAKQASTRKVIAEIGSWKGRSTRAILDNMPADAVLYAVDTWKGSGEPAHLRELAGKHENWLFEQFIANVHEYAKEPDWKLRTCPGTSLEYASYLGGANGCYHIEFDMIFLDASHTYENVKADILAWKPLLAPGGLLCGHDFGGSFEGVQRACYHTLKNPKKVGAGSIWAEHE